MYRGSMSMSSAKSATSICRSLTAPRVRLAPLLPRQDYPGPQARNSNQLHEVDLVAPVYLEGHSHRYYILGGLGRLRQALNQRCVRGTESTCQASDQRSNSNSFGLRRAPTTPPSPLPKVMDHAVTVKMGEPGRVVLK